jgi:hypothetical protein
MEVTVTLPEKVFQDVRKYVELTNRPVDEVISEKLEADFQISNVATEEVISDWNDTDVLELANLKLPEAQDKRLSELFEKQRERLISTSEKVEMEGLIESYRIATFRKAQGFIEAVKRGLVESPEDLGRAGSRQSLPIKSESRRVIGADTVGFLSD